MVSFEATWSATVLQTGNLADDASRRISGWFPLVISMLANGNVMDRDRKTQVELRRVCYWSVDSLLLSIVCQTISGSLAKHLLTSLAKHIESIRWALAYKKTINQLLNHRFCVLLFCNDLFGARKKRLIYKISMVPAYIFKATEKNSSRIENKHSEEIFRVQVTSESTI